MVGWKRNGLHPFQYGDGIQPGSNGARIRILDEAQHIHTNKCTAELVLMGFGYFSNHLGCPETVLGVR